MKKIVITCLLVMGGRCLSFAQINEERPVRQKVELRLADVIEIAFASTDSRRGPLVHLAFKTVKDYFDGVESVPQTLNVRSNRGFTVSVRTSSSTMTYSGQSIKKNNMAAGEALNIRIPENKTGGVIAAPFSDDTYNNLSSQDKMLLAACNSGSDRSFSVQYKAQPKTSYAPGAYSVDVIYTASRS